MGGLAAGLARMEYFNTAGSADKNSGGKEYTTLGRKCRLSALRGSPTRSAAADARIQVRHSFAFKRNISQATPVVRSAIV